MTLIRSTLCVAALVAIAACSSPATRYFATEPVAPPAGISAGNGGNYAGPPLQVKTVNVPPLLDRAELMREVSAGEFEVREFDHWTAPIGQMARQTLTEDLAARFPQGVVIYPDASRPDPVANISVNILAFRFQDNRAVMQVSWTVRSPTLIPALITEGQATLDAAGDDRSGADIAASMSALLGQLADRITTDLGRAAAAKR